MNIFDKNLVSKLEGIHREAEQLRKSLYGRRGEDCSCSHTALCASHASVNNFVVEIAAKSRLAQAHLRRDE